VDKKWWALPAGALLVWYLWSNKGVHTLTLDQRAYAPDAYAPYAHWWHQRSGAYACHYPERVGPNCLEAVLAAQEGAYSTTPQYPEVQCAA
jgi:hypothetical protein